MKSCCEICGKPTNEKVSFLEMSVWEFSLAKEKQQDFYFVCYSCFDKQTNNEIEKDTNSQARKKRLASFDSSVKEEIDQMLDQLLQ